jgi:Transglycosylase SLT domain
MNLKERLRRGALSCRDSLVVFTKDVASGMLEISHNGLAMLGLAVVVLGALAATRPDLVQQSEQWTLTWLRERDEARAEANGEFLATVAEPEGVARATATDPKELSRQQAAVAQWIARRYRVAPEPIARLVQEAWDLGKRSHLEPTLILGIMAIESSFNPFAQSHVGAQGLMQVMTHLHDDKYVAFGGNHAAFDPVSNLRVGVQVLRDCIARAGSLEAGLKHYVGAANLPEDGGYGWKVLAEAAFLQRVANGEKLAPTVMASPPAAPVRDTAAPAVVPPAEAETKPDERVAQLHRPAP